ncbi:beta-lactamase/transpeptidase-like protein [Massarina eburnea CBS 473.64]|uniref:Beta-lactamase/transpeptidase-like protein n=1 Tax=Massarina eburnea CBS 473.64 TaxID=1395130 RepID=A0A6A6RV18_9PLEO|nr:beta-lactamase/transpeptidase-like protein [Massarina eburnea CBS 473.64]
MKCVDKTGQEIYSKIAGYDSVLPSANPLKEDAVVKLASATKLITSIALLQCVERGLILLDDPLSKILPELAEQEILTDVSGSDFTFAKRKNEFTSRHLLSHTSGLGYPFLHPLLAKRAATRGDQKPSLIVTDRYSMPFVFEPGEGWLYGCSLDWAGIVVRRLNNDITLEDYFVDNIWKKVGLSAPFPRFNIATHPEYDARKMHLAHRTSDDGTLEHMDSWILDNEKDQAGGEGLSCTTADYVAVLADLISDSPKLLDPSTIDLMFSPQLVPKSPSIDMVFQLRLAWDTVSGPIAAEDVNHGLGGLLCVGAVPEIGQPGNTLAWGGACNVVWWINRDVGVAGWFATQQTPFGNAVVTKLVNAWKKDFWAKFRAKG